MERWKINLAILWVGQFLVLGGMTMVIPFLPLYIQELGITDPAQAGFWAGLIFAANFVTAFIFQPIWGRLADRHGRKMMLLRSGFGMSIIIVLMGLAGNVWQLLLLRFFNGMIAGFIPAGNAMIAASAPKGQVGYALGILHSGAIAGSILGPVLGGLGAELFGFQTVFFVTGGLIFLAALTVMITVRDEFDIKLAQQKPPMSTMKGLHQLMLRPEMRVLLIGSVVMQLCIMGTMPLIPLFVQVLHGNDHIILFAGIVAGATGLATMMASPIAGRIGDRRGHRNIIIISAACAGLLLLPMAFIQSYGQLIILRFLFGLFAGALIPSTLALIRFYTPDGMEARAISFHTSALCLGNLIGPVLAAFLIGPIGIRAIFFVSALPLFPLLYWYARHLSRDSALEKTADH